MGRNIRFRRGRRLKSLDEFRNPPWKGRVRFGDDRVTLAGVARDTRRWLVRLRPFILGAVLIGIWPAADPALVGPPALLATTPETISATFTHCRMAGGDACVVDGDTFRIGERRIRIIGIDTPEMNARCPEEAALARQATAQLLVSLNAGPFEMRGWAHNRRDRYGRELMALTRIGPPRESIAEEMRRSGVARRYAGGFRGGWC